MAAQLTALGRRGIWPAPHVCSACGSDKDACRGYAGDVWYCTPCVPPALRYPWEAGFERSAAASGMPPPAALVPAGDAARAAGSPDLLTGLTPA